MPNKPGEGGGGAPGSAELEVLRSRLQTLDERLRKLLTSAEEDLEVARHLQKVLHPNRLPEIAGMKCLARFVSSQQLNSETFDIITSQKGREIWFIVAWTESFGLSSALLQAMVHIQSKALIETRTDLDPATVFNDLSVALTEAKRSGHYRLCVARLETTSLKLSGVAVGMAPWMLRKLEKNQLGAFELMQAKAIEQKPVLLAPGISAAPTLAESAYSFQFSVPPGSRLFFLSGTWADATRIEDFEAPLALESQAQKDSALVDDLNHLIMRAEDSLKKQNREADITALAIEVDARKLHLA